MRYIIEQILALALMLVLAVAVLWQTAHLCEWMLTLLGISSPMDGNYPTEVAGLLRRHAYDYTSWFFGTDFGWTVE